MSKGQIVSLCLSAALLSMAAPSVQASDPDSVVSVDWTRTGEPINRGIFSTQGFMQIYVEPDPLVMESFTLINPRGTSTRLETYIHQMEPENDNDDPNVFNWNGFNPDSMIRFIEDRKAFEDVTHRQLGMEPLSLLCYSVPGLKGDEELQLVNNHDEWVEFAAAVVQSYNGIGSEYKPNLQYIEVWNEPNFAEFSIGGIESYFTLFKKTADRIHRDYPGVMVAGPAISHAPTGDPERWMDAFLEECAEKADVLSWHHYGPRGEPVDRLIDDLTERVGKFRKIPGKEKGKAMITEIDAWYHGWPKMQHIFERQFRFLEHSDLLHSVHHFCCMAYNPRGNYTFGVICDQGAIMPGVFWPYWLFRNLIGHEAYTEKQGDRAGNLRLIASHIDEKSQSLSTAVLQNSGKAQIIQANMKFPKSNEPRILVIDRVSENFQGPAEATIIPAESTEWSTEVQLAAGEAVALTLQQPNKRFFAFRDLNNQELPWIGLTSNKKELRYHESADLVVRVLNTNPEPVSGTIKLEGLPADWKVESMDGNAKIRDLAFNKEHTCTFRLTVTSAAVDHVSPYATLVTPKTQTLPIGKRAHSIPVLFQIEPPIHALVLPTPVPVVPGEKNQVTLQLSNSTRETIKGNFGFKPPKDYSPSGCPEFFILAPGSQERFQFPFIVPEKAPQGAEQGKIILKSKEFTLEKSFQIKVTSRTPYTKAEPVDLKKYYNIDPVSFNRKRTAYDSDKVGAFAFPADYLPSDRIAHAGGIPFLFTSLSGNNKTAVEPHGQTIRLTPGNYDAIAFLGFGHSGNHPGTWTFHYEDGTSQRTDSEVPEWCTPAPEGFSQVFHAPHRYMHNGSAPPACQLFQWMIQTNPKKKLVSIELPDLKNAYIFSITSIEK